MDLSIIIPNCNDLRMERCVNSIDEQVELVAALNNPTREVLTLAERLGMVICTVDKNNLGMAYNAGLDAATYDLVLYMDSDCVFLPGAIRRLYEEFQKDPELLLARGYIQFTHNSWLTWLTSRARTVNTTNVPLAFKPPLMLKKRVFEDIGDGYKWAEDVVWAEDYEFELRRSKAGIPLKLVPEAKILHDPLSLYSDLRASFNYGTGKRIRHERTGEHLDLLGVLKDPILRAFKEEGPLVGIYMAAWEATQIAGFYAQKWFDIQGRKGNRI